MKEVNKPKKSTKKSGGHYKAPRNFKLFEQSIPMKLIDVLGMTHEHVFNQIKDREMLNPPRRINKSGKKNPKSFATTMKQRGTTPASVRTCYDSCGGCTKTVY